MADDITVEGRYAQLERGRDPFLKRARAAAKLTIPTLLPPEGHNPTSDFPTPWQGIGARGVNNLASKLLLSLFPPNAPFFRFRIARDVLKDIEQQSGGEDLRTEVEEALANAEKAIMEDVETNAIRVDAFSAIKQLIVSGNVLAFLPKEGGMKVFRLNQYVVKRDAMGRLLEIIVKEQVSPKALPQEVREQFGFTEDEENGTKPVNLFTHIQRESSRKGNPIWRIRQEIKGEEVDGSVGTYPLDRLPWLPLRTFKVEGEDYGRGYVEEYLGDLKSLEGLTRAIVEGSAAAAKVLFLVQPNSSTKKKTLAEAPNGAVREGNSNDVSVLQMEKFNDFRVALETVRDIKERLSFAFLLNSAIQRSGERVTAEEIRFMAGELEDALGGVYSVISQDFQLPLVNVLMWRMQRQSRLPRFPKVKGRESVKPAIVTGLEALGRGRDITKLRGFLEDLGIVAQADPTVLQRLNSSDLIRRLAVARSIDVDGLILSDEEFQAQQQQNQMQQLAEKLGPEGIRQVGQVVQSQQNAQ